MTTEDPMSADATTAYTGGGQFKATNMFFASSAKSDNSRVRLQNVVDILQGVRRKTWVASEELQIALEEASEFNASEYDAVKRIGDSIELAGELISDLNKILQLSGTEFTYADAHELSDVLDRMIDPMRSIRIAVESGLREGLGKNILTAMHSSASEVDSCMAAAVKSCRRPVTEGSASGRNDELLPLAEAVAEKLASRRLVNETRSARDQVVRVQEEAQRVLSDAKRAVGETGSTSLASYFAHYASGELRAANVLRLIAVVIMLMIAGLATLVVFGSGASEDSIAQDVTKLAIAVPLAVLAGRFSQWKHPSRLVRRIVRRASSSCVSYAVGR